MVLESINEDTIRELLQNSRATSRTGSRQYHVLSSGRNNYNDGAPVASASEPMVNGYNPPNYNTMDNRPGSGSGIRTNSRLFEERSVDERQPFEERSVDERQPFLPEINPMGSLITQGLNNQRLNNQNQLPPRSGSGNGGRSSAVTVRNQFSEDWSDAGSPGYPQPPSGRRSVNSRASVRTLSPLNRDSLGD